MAELKIQDGRPIGFGAIITPKGVNFSIYSRNAKKIWLVLFDSENDREPTSIIELDSVKNKTGDVWHVLVEGLSAGALYLYKIEGPYNPNRGQRFNQHKYLFDPYAKAFTKGSVFKEYNKLHATGFTHNSGGEISDLTNFPKCVVVNDDDFDWEGDRSPNYPLESSIIYETHLKGFTASETSDVPEDERGTYKGFTKKAEYLKSLGVTAVELLPVFEFDEFENGNSNPRTGEPLVNYWGYSTIGFFAPKTSYAANKKVGGAVEEFKELVKTLHKNGLEVILDVVYNHTAEGNERGYTFEFRGIENSVYYTLPQDNEEYYMNYSGCGNSMNANHPIVTRFILDSLRYWVSVMHVDGFRFDLASVLTRDIYGAPMKLPPLIHAISEDPILSKAKLIAEPWDCAGLYQLGGFPGGPNNRWSEWNGKFRDDIRRFIRGDDNSVTAAATRICGSSDCYNHSGRSPLASVNFITAHDGFTLNDLVTYNYKHNDENGEMSRDGTDDNFSYNNGFEGECSNPKIEISRLKKIKNSLIYLFVSQGVPMLLGGDEFRRTQHGNNNAYCQDNEISWVDWSLAKKHEGILNFTKNLIALRKKHGIFRRISFFRDIRYERGAIPEIQWYDMNAKVPDWDHSSRFLAFELNGLEVDNDFYIATNMDIYDLTVTLPTLPNGKKWYWVCDTSFDSPHDIAVEGKEEEIRAQNRYVLVAGSTIILMSK